MTCASGFDSLGLLFAPDNGGILRNTTVIFFMEGNTNMDFNALLETLKSPGEDTDIDGIYTDIGNVYNSVADELSSARAAITVLSDEKTALESELLKLKATNFDLLQRVSVEVESRDPEPSDDGEDIEIVF